MGLQNYFGKQEKQGSRGENSGASLNSEKTNKPSVMLPQTRTDNFRRRKSDGKYSLFIGIHQDESQMKVEMQQ